VEATTGTFHFFLIAPAQFWLKPAFFQIDFTGGWGYLLLPELLFFYSR